MPPSVSNTNPSRVPGTGFRSCSEARHTIIVESTEPARTFRAHPHVGVAVGTCTQYLRETFPDGVVTANQSPWQPENEVERLLCSLAGVVSARVVANPLGRLEEIHVLAAPVIGPKQVVRNVQSALSAGLGIIVDRRIISVAQIRRDALEPVQALDSADGAEAARASPGTDAAGRGESARLVFLGWDAQNRSHTDSECRVRVRRDEDEFAGAGAGAANVLGRAQAGARAVFAAVAAALDEDTVALESASVVETHGRSFVLVSARATAGRESFQLTGVARLDRSPEEAAILASLQATNRWIALGA